ncbi:ATG C terminal domain-containing protein [Beauveria bassiana ARSEF 2860]|uniref:Autophagy-related protein 2 n=1 Tax=Beauveria bassiana (strain ARSEF 2860) TaxID=655819 RepID=J5JG56_BEAB2|nr:ATG C terminal domain-containing protein [Beauveria bassiana ARSEF 2860]EJP62566.1 ATG C terminal domain-containing protein [Beauveria bassiana ARSEF 2860]
MASLFTSFTTSSMPKRLLRYALSRLELLDADALNLENLDLALGKNTIFEFRDVGLKLDKLQKLLNLPPAFALQKSKVLSLRITIPIDFYSSPITVDVDGVDVQLKVLNPERAPTDATSTNDNSVPNAVDLAQSFLDNQSPDERRKLQEALEAETQDLGASISMSEDGSQDGFPTGTGQPLSLPMFLADFLQGVLDRMQVKINRVNFSLHMETPTELGSNYLEQISFQISLDSIDIEGVTTTASTAGDALKIVPKEGKRHISIDKVRAFLVSEANIFPTLSRSPSMLSPSSASSPFATRNPPSREPSDIPRAMLESHQSLHFEQTFKEHMVDGTLTPEPDHPLGDSEDALAIPYEMETNDDENPSTPRASIYHDFGASMLSDSDEEPAFSTANSQQMEASQTSTNVALAGSSKQLPYLPVNPAASAVGTSHMHSSQFSADGSQYEDLEESRLYSHEEAESMYMSAFSQGVAQSRVALETTEPARLSPKPENSIEEPAAEVATHLSSVNIAASPPRPEPETELDSGTVVESDGNSEREEVPSEMYQSSSGLPSMPGAWGENSVVHTVQVASEPAQSTAAPSATISVDSASAVTEECSADERGTINPENIASEDVPTPKGPTKFAKKILEFDNLSVYVPSLQRHVQICTDADEASSDPQASMTRSIHPQPPGAFSVHLAQAQKAKDGTRISPVDDSLEIVMSPMTINFDASIAFLLFMITTKLLSFVNTDGAPKSSSATAKQDEKGSQQPPFKIILEQLSLNFLNHLSGVADTADRFLDPSAFDFRQEVLLNLTLKGLAVSRRSAPTAASKNADATLYETKIDLERFRFGYDDGDIVSFDAGKPMSTSVRDTFLSAGNDVSVKILESAEGIRTEVETLPLVFQLELQRLDETFGWFGGLSSFLNMSTSITSSTPPAKTPPTPQQKPRGVRFDTPIKPEDKSAASKNKLNVRIGGTFIQILGKECSISSESNAFKIVSRDEGIGIACSLIRVSGPYIKGSMADPAISSDISGVRLEFLSAPSNSDLEKLLELIIPSKVKYDHTTDEIMVDTLLRQRRKGSVLRAAVDGINVRAKNISQLGVLPNLAEELAKLSTVAKYLPEDDRPGLLTLGKIQRINGSVDIGGALGTFVAEVNELEIGHITLPSLVALSAGGISVSRNKVEHLVKSTPFTASQDTPTRGPVLMVRMIGDEIEPTIKLKVRHLVVEYRVQTIMDLLGLADDATPQDFDDCLAASVANLGDQTHSALARRPQSPSQSSKGAKPTKLDVVFSDCLIGLNPMNLPSKLLIALTDAHLDIVLPKDEQMQASFNVNKASLLLIDDVSTAVDDPTSVRAKPSASSTTSALVSDMCSMGYVDICYISSAMVVVKVTPGEDGEQQVIVDLRDDLLVLETCADSTQTLITLANALKPPTPPSKENKYRTNVVPMQDLLASISAEAFGRSEGDYDFDQDFAGAQEMAGSGSDAGGSDSSFRVNSRYYGTASGGEEIFDATKSMMSDVARMEDTTEGILLTGFDPTTSQGSVDSDELEVHENYYSQDATGEQTAKVWNSSTNTYDSAPATLVKSSPVKVSMRDVHVIWNLFDGYDWPHTRDTISKAVQEVESRAFERQSRTVSAQMQEEEFDDGEAIGDFLFNSIYIGIPANRDPQELSRAINEGLNDAATETESVATTAFTTTTSRGMRRQQPKAKRLRLSRSKHHKITFELQGVNADLVVYPPGSGETQSSLDVRLQNLDVFDHVPTSTWRKFATYDQDQGEREMGTSMVHLEILNVKPIPELEAAEIVLRATLLPLRLHVDQDALDFITRFFEFKDDKVPVHASPSDVPFVQRAEINSVPVKLDFKPKRVDYAGLRSGHTTEFMNFIVLEESRMVLRHVIIYGVSGFDRLGKTLNDIWTPDVRTNQLPGVIAGLAPVRSLVNIGSGFKDLVEIPIREYQKDGRVFRSISKGATAFARTTGTEIVKLGAKLAVGTQYALLGAEEMLAEKRADDGNWDDDELDAEEKKQISLYADQPTGVLQGIRGGYRSLARDVNLARDAIIAVPGEVMENASAAGVAKVMLKRAPTIIFRPAVGVTKVIGQTLLGATNAMDPNNRRRIDEKYKH